MHLPPLILDLAILLGVAALVTFLFRRIRQPVVLGYLIAGILVGPHVSPWLALSDTENIKVWAELGIIFLMFSLGLEFSFRRLSRLGLPAAGTGIFEISAMMGVGILVAFALGWKGWDPLFLGCMLAISSTTIILKTLEEAGLKSKRFAEMVFGILIIEDLAAILMLVALTSVATSESFSGMDLLFTSGKLTIVVGAWVLIGMFLVPRFLKSVRTHGNDELFTVAAVGLCLALVSLAASLQYSVALGAFIMGSLIAEGADAKRIEKLVAPLKNIFGAIFFVSVGMLLEPKSVIENGVTILLISCVVILGKFLFVSMGAFLMGQSPKLALPAALSMTQVGEFSFIIATLGMTHKVISPQLYPIIIGTSVLTTFSTPYLIRNSHCAVEIFEKRLPSHAKSLLESYGAWIERRNVSHEQRKVWLRPLIKWILNAVITVVLFTLAREKLAPIMQSLWDYPKAALAATWGLAFAASGPSFWAMMMAFKEKQIPDLSARTLSEPLPIKRPRGGLLILSRLCTTSLLGILAMEFFPALLALGATFLACVVIFLFFRGKLGEYYTWMERQLSSSPTGASTAENASATDPQPHFRLAPWDAHLLEVQVPADSFVVGKSLLELQLREQYGLNVVILMRNGYSMVAPKAPESLYAGDILLCFATDEEMERFQKDLHRSESELRAQVDFSAFGILPYTLKPGDAFIEQTIRQTQLREKFHCIAVGLERFGKRFRSPSSQTVLKEHDVLWIVGQEDNLEELMKILSHARS
jgi:monovalent cation:H+ antiporter-2, CPA2 family